MKGVWLADLTWPEAKERFDAGAVVIVPIGAAAKEHGHHLPLKTDYLLARELSERIMKELPVVVAPIVTFGYFPAFVAYPGSQHLRSETFIALLKDILSKLARDGASITRCPREPPRRGGRPHRPTWCPSGSRASG